MKVIVKGEGSVNLSQKDYVGSGGEGQIFQIGGTAYKVYHDGHSVVPEGKIEELQVIKNQNVLIPKKILVDGKGKPMGFTMRYVSGTEYLCKLFNKGFRDQSGVSESEIAHLVENLMTTLQEIHDVGILVVDFNEMNFLLDGKDFKIPLFIDTDSYQTQSFPATALMESVRDRHGKPGVFTIETDWFSWAVVAFQLYVGIHPYKGRHPDYKPKEWMNRMQDNVSVFDADVRLPAACQDFSVIPASHLDWFKRVFQDGERGIPPLPGDLILTPVVSHIVAPGDFKVDKIHDYPSIVRDVAYIGGMRYVVSGSSVYREDNICGQIPDESKRPDVFATDDNESPLVALSEKGSDDVVLWNPDINYAIAHIQSDDIMVYSGSLYSRRGDNLVKHVCTKFGSKIVHSVQVVCNVFSPACKLYPGVAVQDIIGKCWVAVPNNEGAFVNVHISELDGHRIVDARFVEDICIMVSEKGGNYFRHVVEFEDDLKSHVVRTEDADATSTATFVKLNKGVCIYPIDGDQLELFAGSAVKIVDGSPVSPDARLFSEIDLTYFVNGNSIYRVTMKK